MDFLGISITGTQIWIISAIILAGAEVFVPGFAVMCLAVGAIASSIASYLEYGILVQWALFCGASLLSAFTIRPLALTFFYRKDGGGRTNTEALIGKQAKVVQPIPGNLEKGRVKVDGVEWSAISEVDLPIPEGKFVVIKKIDGNKLVVELEGS